jgi:hypothetical protein
MNLENNDLRAVAGIILLILAIVLLFTRDETDVVNYIVLALAGFLVGGQIFSGKKDDTSDKGI